MSSSRARSRRRRVWRALVLVSVSLGLFAGGCLLNKVELDGPETQEDVNDLDGSGGTDAEASGSGGAGGGDAGNDGNAQGGTAATPVDGAVGSVCAGNQGCNSLRCVEGLCVAASCDDEITNQDE